MDAFHVDTASHPFTPVTTISYRDLHLRVEVALSVLHDRGVAPGEIDDLRMELAAAVDIADQRSADAHLSRNDEVTAAFWDYQAARARWSLSTLNRRAGEARWNGGSE